MPVLLQIQHASVFIRPSSGRSDWVYKGNYTSFPSFL